jgi:hypothetical protein
MNSFRKNFFVATVMLFAAGCGSSVHEKIPDNFSSPYDEDVAFLKKYGPVVELSDNKGKSKVVVMGSLQARVMTSTSGGKEMASYGWINKSLLESGDTSTHINAFGGEERFWLGPEGGQYSIFFEKGTEFNLENWHTPPLIDLEAYDLVSNTANTAEFAKLSQLTNYSGTVFQIQINRQIRVLEQPETFGTLGLEADTMVNSVAYQTINTVRNAGKIAWDKRTGLLSIWLLGMFNPSPDLTIVVPYTGGSSALSGPVVNDDYFGKVPAERLKVTDQVIYFKGDGQYRSKIGLTPARAKDILGSYDASTNTLTIVRYNKPPGAVDYVNSKWELQSEPYRGDVVNSYNDGPPTPGAKPLGPFYELETSSPAKELQPGDSLTHVQTTFHFQGDDERTNIISLKTLGVSVAQIKSAFSTNPK